MKTQSPLAFVAFFLIGIAFLASEIVLQATIWPMWGPTVAFLAGLVPLALFGWIMGSLTRKTAPDSLSREAIPGEESRKRNRFKSILTPFLIVAWLVVMLSWFLSAEIEIAAISQPNRPTGQFTQPMNLKGVVRYVTPKQATIDEISNWGFLGGWLIFVSGVLFYRWLDKKSS